VPGSTCVTFPIHSIGSSLLATAGCGIAKVMPFAPHKINAFSPTKNYWTSAAISLKSPQSYEK
jgi:hypothetical protein